MKVGMAKTDQERRSDKIREHTHTEQIPKPWTWTSPKKSGGFSLGWPRPDGSLRHKIPAPPLRTWIRSSRGFLQDLDTIK